MAVVTSRSTRRRRSLVGIALIAVLTVIAASCGDDGGSDGDPSGAEPVQGGSATILLYSEQASMDPVRFTGSGSSDAQRAFAVYGALVGLDAQSGETEPILAESLEGNDDFSVWTLTLRDGLVFSDDSPLDAEAVRVNWARIKDPASASPAIALGRTIADMKVVDPLTLEITLTVANAHFDNGVSRQALNYIASAKAIAAGHDLATDPIGAGPFVLDSWVRDDRMVLSRNPTWFEAPGPYLDELTFRLVTDEEQRTDTFLTGGADVMFATDARSITRAIDSSDGDSIITRLATGQTLNFNTSRPPFNDARVRRAIAIGVDRAAMADAAEGEGVDVATHFSVADSKWFVEEGAVPEYDPDEAQRLLSEYADETGKPVKFSVSATQTNRNQAIAKFLQTSFSQYDDVEVDIRTGDFPSFIQWALQADYDVTIWGFPTVDPDPGLYNAVRSGLGTNVSRFSNSDVDAALDAARATDDVDARLEQYREIHGILADEMPFVPLTNTTHGFIASGQMTGLAVFEDGILRVDLLARRG